MTTTAPPLEHYILEPGVVEVTRGRHTTILTRSRIARALAVVQSDTRVSDSVVLDGVKLWESDLTTLDEEAARPTCRTCLATNDPRPSPAVDGEQCADHKTVTDSLRRA